MTVIVVPGRERKFNVVVHGQPGTQGSHDAIPYTKADGKLGVRMVDRKTTRAKLRNWRADVKDAVELVLANGYPDWPGPMEGPLHLVVTFTVPPVNHPRRVRWLASLVETKMVEYVPWPFKRPDLDKYLRATFDALTAAGVWLDDAQVCACTMAKVYPDTPITDAMKTPGAVIGVYQMSTIRVPRAEAAPPVPAAPLELSPDGAPTLFDTAPA